MQLASGNRTEKINETPLFLRKSINLINFKPDWPGYKKEKAQITNNKNEAVNIIIHTTDTKKIISCYV